MDPDYTDRYNTDLGTDQFKFDGWANQQSAAVGRDVTKDKYDYDLQGWWQNNQDANLSGAHLTDQWKKPNHPTFSDQSMYHGVDGNEGGTWQQQGDKYSFYPSSTNMQMHDPADLSDYFNKVEQGNFVIFPQ